MTSSDEKNGQHDAHVQVLTAEVRALMVGSRQVTLSVARQLDYVGLSELEPFGRVRIGDEQRVIGRRLKDGALVLAQFERYPGRVPAINEDDLDPSLEVKPTVCGAETALDGYYRLSFGGRTIRLHRKAAAGAAWPVALQAADMMSLTVSIAGVRDA